MYVSKVPPRPDPPSSLRVVDADATTISVSWMEPSASNNITVYNLKLTDEEGIQVFVPLSVGTNSYNFTNLEEYRNYTSILTATSIYGATSLPTIPVSTQTRDTGKNK